MSAGTRGVLNKKGLTLIEVILSMALLSIIFLAVSSLYVANHRFYLTANDKVNINYELQYAFQHIYENVITGIGDKNNLAVDIQAGNLEFSVRQIDDIDPDAPPTYNDYDDDLDVGYKIDSAAKTLLFDSDDDGVYEESLVPTIDILGTGGLSSFTLEDNVLIIKLTGESKTSVGDTKQRLTMYSACYPRLNAFQ